MRAITILAIWLSVFHGGYALAQPQDHLGKGFPMGQGPAKDGTPTIQSDVTSIDGLSREKALEALRQVEGQTDEFRTRGTKEANLYRRLAPSVVWVLTDKGRGSGSLISADEVLTNWHVVEGSSKVGVVFKPKKGDGRDVTTANLVGAKVVKVDAVADLALLKLAIAPVGRQLIKLGTGSEIEVGDDVHAIGHPHDNTWTYTKGIISQIRRNHEWKAGEGVPHKGDIIQTQTPINPGNSGGPLLNDAGHLIGVNTYISEGEGLNFAVSVDTVRDFLEAPSSRLPPESNRETSQAPCKPKILHEGRSPGDDGYMTASDLNCDGRIDATIETPDDPNAGYIYKVDTNGDGMIDIVVIDQDRDRRWDTSYHDVDHDGRLDMIGHHPDGKLKPSSYEPYKS